MGDNEIEPRDILLDGLTASSIGNPRLVSSQLL